MADAVSKSLSDLTKELSKSNNSAKEAQALRLKEEKAQLDQMEKDAQEKGIELKDNKKFRDAQLAHQKANLDFRSKNATSRAAQKEINKEKSKLQESYFKKYLGKNSFFGKGFSSIGNSLKKKVGGGIDSIFKALKAGAFILFLGGLKKFLESDLFQEMMDKIIPVVVTGLKNLRDVFNKFKENIPTMVEDAKEFVRKLEEEVLPKIKEFSEGFYSAFFYVKDKIFQVQAYMKTPEFKESFEKLKDFAKEVGEGFLFVKDEIIALKDYVLSEEFKENFSKVLKVLKIFAGGFAIIRDVVLAIYDTFWDEAGNFKGLEGVKEVISDVYDGFINFKNRIKEGFFDEDGNFSISAGFANIGIEISNITSAFTPVATALGTMLLLVKPKAFFGTLGVVGRGGFALGRGVLRGISSSFSKVFTALTGLGTNASDLEVDMNTRNKNAKSGGVFSKKRGVGGKFGKLFGLVGRFGGLIAGVGIGMLSQLDLSKASGVLSDTAKGIGSAFKSLFSVVGDFATSIANVASKATAKVASVVADALSAVKNIGNKPITTTEADARRRLRKASGQSDYQRRLKASKTGTSPKVTTDLGDGANQVRPGPDDISPKVSSAVVAPTIKTKPPNLTTFNTTSPNIPMMDLKSSKITPTSKKLSKEVTEKVLSRSIAKNAAKLALKSVIVVGAVTSGYFALSKLLKGDYVGAAMEGGDIFAPSLVGLPLSTATTIRDIYNESYGTPSNKYPFDKDLVNNPTETNKRLGVIKDQLMKQLGMNKSKKKPPAMVKPQENSSDTIDFSKIKKFSDYQKVQGQLRINPNYDADGSGIYSKKEFRVAQSGAKLEGSGSPVYEGPMFLQPTRIVTNNQQSVVISRPITDTSFGGIMSSR